MRTKVFVYWAKKTFYFFRAPGTTSQDIHSQCYFTQFLSNAGIIYIATLSGARRARCFCQIWSIPVFSSRWLRPYPPSLLQRLPCTACARSNPFKCGLGHAPWSASRRFKGPFSPRIAKARLWAGQSKGEAWLENKKKKYTSFFLCQVHKSLIIFNFISIYFH